jgi:hypothetical protein
MQRHSTNGLDYYTFESLDDKIIHALSSRDGGVSPAPFDTLNLSVTTGDVPSNVNSNIERLHDALALDKSATVTASQAQADKIAIVDSSHRGTRIQNVDSLITNRPNFHSCSVSPTASRSCYTTRPTAPLALSTLDGEAPSRDSRQNRSGRCSKPSGRNAGCYCVSVLQ